uniref:Uncharacterized protein n=1 Tax=Anguilla anguilla TaxID=7936 RepID=A0A0E9SAT3_ANGAN
MRLVLRIRMYKFREITVFTNCSG